VKAFIHRRNVIMHSERLSPPNSTSMPLRAKSGADHLSPSVAHDVKGLAAPLQLIGDELAGSPDARLRLLGTRIETCVSRMVAFCDPALPSRPGPGDAKAPVPDILDDVRAMTEFLVGPRTSFTIHGTSGAAEFDSDPRLFRVLFNLTANAVRAVNANGGGRVTMSARAEPGALCIDVADDAGGLRPHEAPSAPPSAPSGHGLGLVIAEGLAQALGGALDLVRTGPDGTLLRVTLPLNRH
jgi:signal transduction histidine kinase